MKLTKLALLSLGVGLSVSAQAATLNVNNLGSLTGQGGDTLLLLDNSGNALTSGFVALYTFTGGAPTTAADLRAVGDTGLLERIALTPGNSPGGGAFTSAFNPANDGSLDGVNLFLVVGTGTDMTDSDGLGLIDTGLGFAKADTPPPPDSQTYVVNVGSTVLIGNTVPGANADWSFAGQPNFTGLGVQTVPEPSSSLLFGLAGLTLLIRRKR